MEKEKKKYICMCYGGIIKVDHCIVSFGNDFDKEFQDKKKIYGKLIKGKYFETTEPAKHIKKLVEIMNKKKIDNDGYMFNTSSKTIGNTIKEITGTTKQRNWNNPDIKKKERPKKENNEKGKKSKKTRGKKEDIKEEVKEEEKEEDKDEEKEEVKEEEEDTDKDDTKEDLKEKEDSDKEKEDSDKEKEDSDKEKEDSDKEKEDSEIQISNKKKKGKGRKKKEESD